MRTNSLKLVFGLILSFVLVASESSACPYRLVAPKFRVLKYLAKENIDSKKIPDYSKYIDNPFIAALIYRSDLSDTKLVNQAKLTILASYKYYEASAEIIYKDVKFFDKTDPKESEKAKQIRQEIKNIWPFANIEVAIANLESPETSNAAAIERAKMIFSQNTLSGDAEMLFYFGLSEFNYGNRLSAASSFLASSELGYFRSIPYLVKSYKDQGVECKEFYEVTKLIYDEGEVKIYKPVGSLRKTGDGGAIF